MSELVHELIHRTARNSGDAIALKHGSAALSYRALDDAVRACARGMVGLGIDKGERVAIYLEKRVETVVAMFGAAAAGAVYVPINPLLKPQQAAYIMRDCNVRALVTSPERLRTLGDALGECHDLRQIILTDGTGGPPEGLSQRLAPWKAVLDEGTRSGRACHRVIDADMAAILYTSGSTGMPKGVVLSHRNIVTGAKSVSGYLENTPEDRILCVLPFSFDYGMSQLTTAFTTGARAVLINYLVPRDVVKACAREAITGLACVPPLWMQLAALDWPAEAAAALRYITNSGGAMPGETLKALRQRLPDSAVYLMYGLTEAFRSTYLPPSEVDRRPDSIGRAIPNAEILVVRENGELCGPGEPGELVHRGGLVALGYWNDPARTAERFKPAPAQSHGVCNPEIAVWSGDTVRMDEEGYLYFVGRRDEMIKTSGYRVSPTEVEEVIYATGQVAEVIVVGVPHPTLGQGIVAIASPLPGKALDTEAVLTQCRRELPAFMVPQRIVERADLPRNPNGKIDRKILARDVATIFGIAA